MSSMWNSILSSYNRAISFCVRHLRKRNVEIFSLVVGTFLTEPWSVFKGSIMTPLGWKRDFNYYGLNPKELSNEQMNRNPVLLIHGNFDNQRVWFRLASKLQQEGIPAFTVNLPYGRFTHKDKAILEIKWNKIKKLYSDKGRKDVRINVVGHSRGGYLSVMMGVNKHGWDIDKEGSISTDLSQRRLRRNIGKIIQIGQYFSRGEFQDEFSKKIDLKDKIYSITGSQDILAPEESDALPPEHKFSYDCGHLGLIFSDQVDQKIIELLQSKG